MPPCAAASRRPGPARPVFRSNAEMMLLTTRLHLDADGRVHMPGDLEVWKALFEKNPKGKYDARLSKAAVSWKDPDDVVEALFALCRKPVDNEPLKIFMALSDMDRNRAQPLKTETVQRLVHAWSVLRRSVRDLQRRADDHRPDDRGVDGCCRRRWTRSAIRRSARTRSGTFQGLTGTLADFRAARAAFRRIRRMARCWRFSCRSGR